MSLPKNPGVSVSLTIPRDVGTDSPVYSTRPYAGVVRTEGRVRQGGWDPITRGASDDAGQPLKSSAGALLNDDDGVIREAYAENPTRFVSRVFGDITILSDAGRAASLSERLLLRCRVNDAHVEISRSGQARKRSVKLLFEDALAPYYDQLVPKQRFLRADYPDIDRKIENTPIPLVIGEHSDAGALDVNGNNAEKGLVPVIYVGGRKTIDDDPTSGSPSYLAPPSVITPTVNGTPGTRTLYYGVTALSEVGETVLSAIVTVTTAPAVLNGTDSITLVIDEVPGATGYIVYGRRNATPVRRLAVLGPATGSPATISYTDDGSDVEYAPGPPAVNTAQVEVGSPGEFFWDFYVVCMGWVEIVKLYGSNVQAGVEPARVDISATEGVDFIKFHGLIGGNEITGFYARGPRSQHHKDGIVTFAVQTCGYEDVGDGSGDTIQQAFPQLQFVLNEFVLKNGGAGYTSGLWGPLETFNNGSPATPILQTSKFTDCQDLTKDFLGNAVGALGALYLREPVTVRQLLQWFFVSHEAHGATNHHGQFFPILYDAAADPSSAPILREHMEVVRLENPALDKDHVEPRILFQFDYDPDAAQYRSEIVPVQDDIAVDDQQGVLSRDPEVKQLRWTRDRDTAVNAMERRRDRLKYPRWKQTVITKFSPSLEIEPGDMFRVTHADGPMAIGWTDRPFLAVSHVVDLNRGEVAVTGYDLYPLLSGSP